MGTGRDGRTPLIGISPPRNGWLGPRRERFATRPRTIRAAIRNIAGSLLLYGRSLVAAGLLTLIVATLTTALPARAANLVTGVNIVNPERAGLDDQNALIAQLRAAGVRVVRCGISDDAKGADFARRLAAAGIAIELIVGLKFPAGVPTRAYQPREFPEMWGGPPLSFADPERSRAYFASLLSRLDAGGITLAGIELGNELNWTAFNPEFPLPGEGKTLGLDDLAHDPEGQQIAKGFLQYLKVLRELKAVRDASGRYAQTPIMTAGFVDAGPPGERRSRYDDVSLAATLAFMRAHGLDDLVDAYAVHTYPGGHTAAARRQHLEDVTVADCHPPGSLTGKPCWITEWGFPNADESCPLDDSKRAARVREFMDDFRALARAGRVAGEMYFAWDSDPWSKHVDRLSVYRCGVLTEAGRALQEAPERAAR